ncbi:MAG: glycoside hydrolase family 65 protein [Candidatus Binatia bacterium]
MSERSWDPGLQGVREAQFTLGNGLIGSRGILEELPQGARPGTYLSGFFDRTGSLVAELVNIPNPFSLWFSLKGEKLGIVAMDSTSHRRDLDLRHGLLFRQTIYRDIRKRKYDYQSLRFLSMEDRNVGVMQVYLKALEGGADLSVEAALDTWVWNSETVTEGRKKHWRICEVLHERGMEYVRVSGLDDEQFFIAFATSVTASLDGRPLPARDSVLRIHLRKGQTVCLTKIVVIHPSRGQAPAQIFSSTRQRLSRAMRRGFSKLLSAHIRAWSRLWASAAISIRGDPKVQKALRFNLYHLLCAAPAPGSRCSIGAKALSGDGYRGHIFWDSDIFLLPFFTHVRQTAAVDMLLYRYDRLNMARQIARQKKYRGAMYPWESAGTGEEETPAWAKGLDGTVIPISTHEQEHHITADIAYAIHRYYTATGDDGFMLACGFEMLFETARFWVSRVEYDRRKHIYRLNRVIGPDEFHEAVDNNAYTNMMAKWNLLVARRMALHMKAQFPLEFEALCKRIDLKPSEIRTWKQIAPRIEMKARRNGVIEQFDGYFKRQPVRLRSRNRYGLPEVPRDFVWKDVGKTQIVKQADVLMLLYLLPDIFGVRAKKINYRYYEPRTVHKSSLSPGLHAIVAAEVGQIEAAYNFFQAALFVDLENPAGNTADGIHAASLGMVWQAVVCGFGGVKLRRGELHIWPRLPNFWKAISFRYLWRGAELRITVERRRVRLHLRSRRKIQPGRIRIFGHLQHVPVNRTAIFRQ